MTQDERVGAALGHWAARLVANGVPLADFQDVTSSIARWEDWCGAWSARAALHEAMGREALDAGHGLSAGEHVTTAAVCYHFAKFLCVHDLAEMRAAHEKAVACHTLALPHLRPPGERVEIPYERRKLKAVLRKPARTPAGVDRPPVLIMASGLDSAKEEMGAYARPFLDRGLAILAFDGPGQGEGEYDFAIRGDYEVPVKAVVDWLETREDINANQLGLWGVSLGGYYAPRAAAFEKRIKACIALSGPFDWSEAFDTLPDLTREAFRVRSKCETVDEARAHAATLSLAEAAPNITCPLYVVAGKLDRVIPWEHAKCLADTASGPTKFLLVEDGTHVVNNRAYRYRLQTADWMAEILGGAAR